MPDDRSFQELIDRMRQGDNNAWAELQQRYGETLLRVARVRLMSRDMQRNLNPSDVVQSVMAEFYHQASAGRHEFGAPEDVLKLLTTMVNRKINDHRKKKHAAKRGGGKAGGGDVEVAPDVQPSPSMVVAEKELFEKVWDWLSPADRDLVRLVVWDKLPWTDVAARIGVTSADAARKRFERLCATARERWAGEERRD